MILKHAIRYSDAKNLSAWFPRAQKKKFLIKKAACSLIARGVADIYRTNKKSSETGCRKGQMPKRNGGSELRNFQETKAKLADDLRLVAHDAEELMKATAGELAEKTRDIREHMKVALEDAKARCAELSEDAEERFREADRVVRENPYRSMAFALGAGVLVGILLKRRS
jgi:ElaB/YqjD/DUF883 family membrane-anchored ribosome-binding protein